MRFQRWSVVALGMAITLISPTAGFGDSTPSTTPGPTSNIQDSKAAYKNALSMFKAEVKLREQNRKKINQVFIQAVNEANRRAKTSMNLATSASAKREILLQQKAAIALANSIRIASILAMGDALELPEDPNEAVETGEASEPAKKDKKDSEPSKRDKPEKVGRTPSP